MVLSNRTNLLLAPRRSPSIPCCPLQPRASPLPSPTTASSRRPAQSAAVTPRRVSAPESPDLPLPATADPGESQRKRLSCPSTPTLAPPTPGARDATGRTPSGKSHRVRVALRVRPPNAADRGDATQALFVDGNTVRVAARLLADGRESAASLESVYIFDTVLTGDQQQVYEAVGRPLLDDVLQGYNVCLFAYGQTATGKTYSLQGPPDDAGLIPRLLRDLFSNVDASSQVVLSLFEIYNERLRDLLARPGEERPLDLMEDGAHRVQVRNLSKHHIPSAEAALAAVAAGAARRQVGATMMNGQSSRSHLVLQLVVTLRETESMVTITDLAGSDRASKTEATGETFRESKNINHSLLMLGRSLNSMSEGHVFVPSRDSKVTRLLAAYLQGNCQTVLLATVSPAAFNATESVCTMDFAINAAAVKKVVRPNSTVPRSALAMRDLKAGKAQAEERCAELEQQLRDLRRQHDEEGPVGKVRAEERCAALEGQLRDLQARLEEALRDNAALKERVRGLEGALIPAPSRRLSSDSVDMLTDQEPAAARVASPMEAHWPAASSPASPSISSSPAPNPPGSPPLTPPEAAGMAARMEEAMAALQGECEVLRARLTEAERHRAAAVAQAEDVEAHALALQDRLRREMAAVSARCEALDAEGAALRGECAALRATSTGPPPSVPRSEDDDWLASSAGSGARCPLLDPLTPQTPTRADSPPAPGAASSGQLTPILRAFPPPEPDPAAANPGTAEAAGHPTGRSPPPPPRESIDISDTESEEEGEDPTAVVVVRPPPRRRTTVGPTSMVTRSASRRSCAPLPEVAGRLQPGMRVTLRPYPPHPRPQADVGYAAEVVSSYAAGVFLIRLTQGASVHFAPGACGCDPDAHRPVTPGALHTTPKVPRGECGLCNRRLTGYVMYCRENRPRLPADIRTIGDANRQLGLQWRRLSIRTQHKYNALAAQCNAEPLSPLCRGTYQRFASELRSQLKAKRPRLNAKEVVRRISASWRTLPPEAKRRYSLHTKGTRLALESGTTQRRRSELIRPNFEAS